MVKDRLGNLAIGEVSRLWSSLARHKERVSKHHWATRHWFAAGAAAVCLTSCAPSTPFYSTELVPANLSTGAKSSAKSIDGAKSTTVRVVYSSNTEQAEKYLEGVGETVKIANPIAYADRDPAYFKTQLKKLLSERFAGVEYSGAAREAGSRKDVSMVVDFQTKLGWYSGTVTRAQITGILLDERGAEIARIDGKGESVIPFPAFNLQFQATVDMALAEFAAKLDRVLR